MFQERIFKGLISVESCCEGLERLEFIDGKAISGNKSSSRITVNWRIKIQLRLRK